MRLKFGAALRSVFVLWAAHAFAQEAPRFGGRVVDEGGAPVAGALVSIVGATGTARTDADGRFTWEPAPSVPFQAIIVLPNGVVARPVLVDTLAAGERIQVSGLTDESITVLGAASSIDSTPGAATTILSSRQIAQRNPEHLMQALETVPGINQVSEGHAAVPAVRGMARGRTLFLIDGARVSAERRVGASATFLDPSVIEGVDVARGPGSVAYGSDALGGVISVRTRRAEAGSPLRARVTGTVGGGVPEARGTFEISHGLERGGMLLQAHVRDAEDYDSPKGEIFNSGWEDRGVLAHFTHTVARGLLSAAWQGDFGRDIGRPRNNSRSVRFSYPYENSHRFTFSYELPDTGGFRQIAMTTFLGAYEQRTDQETFATSTAGRTIERADVSANDFQVKGSAERVFGATRVELGIDVNGRYNLAAFDITQAFDPADAPTQDDTNVSIDDARRVNAGIYAQAEAAVGASMHVSGGIRGDRVTTRNIGGFFGDLSTSNGAVAGFGAVTVAPIQAWSFTAQVSRGFRDPVLSDRYFRGPSGRGFITGNPDLRPETSVQFDLAARYTLARAQVAVYAYQYRINDLVERYETETDFFFFRNRGRARLRGLEIEGRADIGRGYSLELAGHLARGVALDDDASLDDLAADSISLIARKAFGRDGYAQVRIAHHADDNRPGPTEVAAPGATLVDLGAGWQVLRQLEIRGAVRNAFDQTYFASADPRWVYAPGRSASLTAAVQF